PQCLPQYFYGMIGLSLCAIFDLVAATGAGRGYEHFRWRVSHRREQHQFANVHRDFIMFFLIAERACHTAAPRGDDGDFVTRRERQYFRGIIYQVECLLVAMSVELYLARGTGKRSLVDMTGIHFAGQELIN